MAQEPDLSLRQQPLLRYWLATRPAFLAASVVPALVGEAAAWAQGYALHGWLVVRFGADTIGSAVLHGVLLSLALWLV